MITEESTNESVNVQCSLHFRCVLFSYALSRESVGMVAQ
jgi:hypothetical protein